MTDFYSYGIDHLNIGVADAERARDFYVAALDPLGIDLTLSIPPKQAEPGGDQARAAAWMFGFASRSAAHKPFFWLLGGCAPGQGLHVAFAAATRTQVDAFHVATVPPEGRDWITVPPHIGTVYDPQELSGRVGSPTPDVSAPFLVWYDTPYAHMQQPEGW